MPATLLPFRTAAPARRGVWSLLEVALPGERSKPLGILLVDEESNRLSLRMRDSSEFGELEEQEVDYLDALASDLEMKASEGGGRELFRTLEGSLSGFLRMSDRTAVEYSGEAAAACAGLFDEHVDAEVRPFISHLPLYGLRAAATRFGEEFDAGELAEPEAWVRVPRGLRFDQGMFVTQVAGRSMEPLIPDGSYCIFHAPVTGTRQGRRLLIEHLGRYTVKRYTSVKAVDGDEWRHASIRLEPLNPEFEAFELGEGEFRVIAEFVQVL